MNINLIEALLFGVVSGLTEFMPVSSFAHQKLMLIIFGSEEPGNLLNLFVHIGMLTSLLVATMGNFKRSLREYRIFLKPARRRKREPVMQAALEHRFIRTAYIPVIGSFFLYSKTTPWGDNPPYLALFLLLNGILLYIPSLLSRGNKDARNMSVLDGVLFGLGGALSVFPGVSGIGASSAVAVMRGADVKEAYKWSLLLCVPILCFSTIMDVVSLFAAGFGGINLLGVLACMLSCCIAYFVGNLSISLMKTLAANKGITGFAYYCWGAALFTFILYLY